MGLIQAFTGAITGTFADQWKDIITAGQFDERVVVSPGVLQQQNRGRGSNYRGSEGVISNGSKIFVPENTAAFIFSQGGIEEIITTPGGYEYQTGQASVFSNEGIMKSLIDQAADRLGYGGQTADQKRIAFVNLREIRGIKFGTKGPLVYNDPFYGADLEITAFGSFSLRVSDPEKFIRNYVPAQTSFYTFDNPQARTQITSEFLQSLIDAINTLSAKYRISQLPSQANELSAGVAGDTQGAGTWGERFGFEVVAVGIENIEFSPESRELVKEFTSNKMKVKAYEDVSQQSSNIAAQQKIAQGVENHGLGDGGSLILGMGVAQSMNPQTGQVNANQAPSAPQTSSGQFALSVEEQIEALKKLKELLDAEILTQEEFATKKKEILGT
jgi:membrane protease subunit (stomatin/prohibitin family)